MRGPLPAPAPASSPLPAAAAAPPTSPAPAPAAAAAPTPLPPPLALPALPVEILEAIAGQLSSQRDRLAMLSCCKALWARADVAGSPALWGAITISRPLMEPACKQPLAGLPSLLARRRTGLRTLAVHLPRLGSDSLAAVLAGAAGSPLEELHLGGNRSLRGECEAALAPLTGLSRLRVLDLRCCGIRAHLPLQLTVLAHSLERLDVSLNELGGSSGEHEGDDAGWEALGRLSCLTSLEARRCDLARLPATLPPSLRELRVGANPQLGQGGEAAWHPLEHLPSLTRLEVPFCGMDRLPPQLAAATALRHLNISSNHLLGRSDWSAWAPLARLAALTALEARRCGLRALPPQLAGLRSLEWLELGCENMSGPAALEPLGELGSLRWLGLSTTWACRSPTARALAARGVTLVQ